MAVLPLWTGSTTVAAEAGVEVAAAAAIESVASAVNAANAANVEIGIGKNVARPTQMNETGAAGA